MALKHKHHIIPKHMGGSDDSTNIIELTVEEHAEEHKKLYEKHGKWQDFIAWKGLEGRIGKEEIEKLIHIQNGLSRRGIPQTPEHIQKRTSKIRGKNNGMSGRVGELNPMYGKVGELSPHFGKKHSVETCKKKSIALKNISYDELHGPEKSAEIKKKLSAPKSEEHKSKLRKPKPKVVTRIYDKRLMPISNFIWWNKRQ